MLVATAYQSYAVLHSCQVVSNFYVDLCTYLLSAQLIAIKSGYKKKETTMKCKFYCHCEKPLENKYGKLSQYLMNQQTEKPNCHSNNNNCNPHSNGCFKYNAYDI